MSHLDAYLAGNHRQVWEELNGLGASLFENEQLLAEAKSVARETMLRVRNNIQTIIERLRDLNYRFSVEAMDELFGGAMAQRSFVYSPPDPNEFARLEELVSSMPLVLRSWFEIVGSVNLMGTHPRLGPASDPLVVMSPREIIAELSDRPTSAIPLFPTAQAKAGGADGLLYSVRATQSMDAPLQLDRSTTFLGYLRHSLQWGGFPGLANAATPELERLRSGLAEF